MAQYTLNIVNGIAYGAVPVGTYSATISGVPAGFSNGSLAPNSGIVIGGSTTDIDFTIATADAATLTLNVKTVAGDVVPGSKFQLCNADGSVVYGNEITSSASGVAQFLNLAYDATTPYQYHFKQTYAPTGYTADSAIHLFSMESVAKSINISNPRLNERTVNLTDFNYDNLPLSGALVLNDGL